MTHTTLGRAAIVSFALGAATIGCTPSGHIDHVASASDTTGAAGANRDAAKARRALDRHDATGAIRFAERAAAADPAAADHRMLLGQAYLGAGRFASAAASFRDALALAPDQPHAGFDLALSQIALGLRDEALVNLAGIKGRIPDADLGLALALAGDRKGGIAMLTDVVRAGRSDARARQNLALALALDGQWGQARGLAMQDTAPDRLENKLAGWRTMAHDGSGARQVAAMLGTAPAIGDPGRPTRLALATPAAPAPVALALATPPVAPVGAVPTPPRPAAPVVAPAAVAAAVALVEIPATVPTLLAVAPARAPIEPLAIPRLIRTAAVLPTHATPSAPMAPGPILHAVGRSGFVVQLGAYARSGALDTAWASASRLSPKIATFTPVQGSTLHRGATLVRLAIGGFATHDEASGLCGQIKDRGGVCFVRAMTGDRPWQWAGKATGTQLAMR